MADSPPMTDLEATVEKDEANPAVRQISATSSNSAAHVDETRAFSLDNGDVKYRTLSWWRAGVCKPTSLRDEFTA